LYTSNTTERMNPFTIIYCLSFIVPITFIASSIALAMCLQTLTSLHKYSVAVTPQRILWLPFTCIISLLLASYSFAWWIYVCISIAVLYSIVSFIPAVWHIFAYTIFLVCLLCSTSLLLQTAQQQQMINLLQSKRRTIHCIVDNITPWNEKGSVVTFAITHIDAIPMRGYIRYYLSQKTDLAIGEQFVLKSIQAPKQLNIHFQRFLQRDGVLTTLFAKKAPGYRTHVYHPLYDLKRFFHAQRAAMYAFFKNRMPAQTFTFFSSLFLGNKTPKSYPHIKKQFSAWGLAHFLARSGIHIAIIILLLTLFLLLFPLHYTIKYLILVVFLGVYSLFSWSSLSFERALWFFLLYVVAHYTTRRPHALYLFSILTTFILLQNPFHLFFLDFQLSFFLTFTLIAFATNKKNRFFPDLASHKTNKVHY